MNGSTTRLFGSVAEITEGTEERQAFAEHYGVISTYLIAGETLVSSMTLRYGA
jgi:hypothetical protein